MCELNLKRPSNTRARRNSLPMILSADTTCPVVVNHGWRHGDRPSYTSGVKETFNWPAQRGAGMRGNSRALPSPSLPLPSLLPLESDPRSARRGSSGMYVQHTYMQTHAIHAFNIRMYACGRSLHAMRDERKTDKTMLKTMGQRSNLR